jgi:hypothetical protein
VAGGQPSINIDLGALMLGSEADGEAEATSEPEVGRGINANPTLDQRRMATRSRPTRAEEIVVRQGHGLWREFCDQVTVGGCRRGCAADMG